MNGCKFTLTGAGQPAGTFLLDVAGCTEGKTIQIKSALCTVDIGEQNGLPHLMGTTLESSPNEVTLQAQLTGISVLQTGALCPDGTNHETASATATMGAILKGYELLGSEARTEHGHQFIAYEAGGQVEVVAT